MARFIDTRSGNQATSVSGDWTLDNLAAIQKETAATTPDAIDAEIGRMDTAGALLLHRWATHHKATIRGLSDWQQSLLTLIAETEQEPPEQEPRPGAIESFFIPVGKKAYALRQDAIDLVRFVGETAIRMGGIVRQPKRLRGTSLLRHLHEAGVSAIPIVALIAFLISVVLAYQGAEQLRRFGAEIFTINMIAISVLREMGVLLTAIMIAGRSGSAFTAEIGVMKVNEEVDAMKIIGIRPFEFLVIPRILALMIAMPILTFIADMMGLLGGGIISLTLLDITPEHYIERLQSALRMKDFWVGMSKAPVFGFVIAVVGCMRGMQVSGSAESVGRLTTISVVQSIFLVLLLDALFSLLFTHMGI